MVLNPASNGESYLDIGGLDTDLYSGEIDYIPVKQVSGYWAI